MLIALAVLAGIGLVLSLGSSAFDLLASLRRLPTAIAKGDQP